MGRSGKWVPHCTGHMISASEMLCNWSQHFSYCVSSFSALNHICFRKIVREMVLFVWVRWESWWLIDQIWWENFVIWELERSPDMAGRCEKYAHFAQGLCWRSATEHVALFKGYSRLGLGLLLWKDLDQLPHKLWQLAVMWYFTAGQGLKLRFRQGS